MKREIIVTAEAEAIHRWPEAPPPVTFLANEHRHQFHFRVGLPVSAPDRQLEFLIKKAFLQHVVEEIVAEVGGVSLGHLLNFGTMSCEHLAEQVLLTMGDATWVEVWEDNENGARVER